MNKLWLIPLLIVFALAYLMTLIALAKEPVKCPYVPNFKEHTIVQLDAHTAAEEVLLPDGCPALVVVIPIDRNEYKHPKINNDKDDTRRRVGNKTGNQP